MGHAAQTLVDGTHHQIALAEEAVHEQTAAVLLVADHQQADMIVAVHMIAVQRQQFRRPQHADRLPVQIELQLALGASQRAELRAHDALDSRQREGHGLAAHAHQRRADHAQGDRQAHHEGGTAADLALDAHRTAQVAHGLVHHIQSHAASAHLRHRARR